MPNHAWNSCCSSSMETPVHIVLTLLCQNLLRGAIGAIVGFANYLLKLYLAEQPWATSVGWDTLDVPNHRQVLFPPYLNCNKL